MKIKLFILVLIIVFPLNSMDLKSEDDFSPQPLEERPLANVLIEKLDNKPGIAVTSFFTALGVSATIYNTYTVFENDIRVSNKDTQEQIFLISTSLIFTSITSWILKAILAE